MSVTVEEFIVIIGAACTVAGAVGGSIVWKVLQQMREDSRITRAAMGILLLDRAKDEPDFENRVYQYNREVHSAFFNGGRR